MDGGSLIQGSSEWIAARVGSLGASRLHEAVTRTKTGYGASRANLMAEILLERITGEPAERFVTQAMQYGMQMEPEARDAYSFYTNKTVIQVGIIIHPKIEKTHASPDGLVDDDGLIEIKVPQPATHLETLLEEKVPEKYVTQMLWQMAVTGRRYCDYVSYNPSFPENMRLFVKRVNRDDKRIKELETEVAGFLAELALKLAQLNSLYGVKEAAE